MALAPEAAGDGAPGFALATDVAVVDVTDVAVTVAVPRDVAPRLAVAFGQGAVTLARFGSRPVLCALDVAMRWLAHTELVGVGGGGGGGGGGGYRERYP